MKTNKDYQWLRSIHRYWILPAEMLSTVLLIGALLSAVFLSLLGARQLVDSTLGGLLVASFSAAMIQHFLFYRLIRCPTCGHNPTRYKNGKNLPRKTAWKRLQVMESCPVCAGDPNEPNVAEQGAAGQPLGFPSASDVLSNSNLNRACDVRRHPSGASA